MFMSKIWRTGKITQLTTDGSQNLINGTSDWVNEEEFFLRDCWRWSPDSKSIAYWQFDAEGIKDFVLVDNTKDLYPVLTYIPYPKAGTTNAAVRVGVVSADGGQTKWMNTPGDLRQNYIVMMDWTDNSNEIDSAASESPAEYRPVDDCRCENRRGANDFDRKRRAWIDVDDAENALA